jgi:uncharacterized protein
MKIILLDTNFMITCVKQKIDFFEEINLMGMKIFVPEEVIKEIKKIANSKQKAHSKDAAEITLKILEKNIFEKIDLDNKNVDKGIIKFANKNKDVVIATLDKEIKDKIENPKLVIRQKKRLEIL